MAEQNEQSEEFAHMDRVDVDTRAHRPTEHDEDQALAELYGPADEDGIHRGTGA